MTKIYVSTAGCLLPSGSPEAIITSLLINSRFTLRGLCENDKIDSGYFFKPDMDGNLRSVQILYL